MPFQFLSSSLEVKSSCKAFSYIYANPLRLFNTLVPEFILTSNDISILGIIYLFRRKEVQVVYKLSGIVNMTKIVNMHNNMQPPYIYLRLL